jgi:acetylornithine/N-succinyldiaminopimelate aminotransferase
MNNRHLFQQFLAQTSQSPVALEIARAKGSYLYDSQGNRYLDFIGGISVCHVGHSHPHILASIKKQVDDYLHVMVYGELIQSPQVQYAKLLTDHLPPTLNNVYFTNSGAEATEGALKLAKRYTGRPTIISCHQAYHGSTTGALAVMGDEYWRSAFRPLMPGVERYAFNSDELIEAVDHDTACVIVETVQGEAGIVAADARWLYALRQRCTEMNTLLILDEIQCGFGRTGRLWAFEHYGVVPDILLLGKALGGGMPLGAFISSKDIMHCLTNNPVLGHITTFGGHPVCCAAGMAGMEVLINERLTDQVPKKEQLLLSLLHHEQICEVRSKGLLMAVRLRSGEQVMQTLQRCLDKGLFADWFLFAPDCIRIAPPLNISEGEIRTGCAMLISSLE